MLDFCPVSSGVGEIAVLLNGDLKRCTVNHGCSLGLSVSSKHPQGLNMSGLGNKPTPLTVSEQIWRQRGLLDMKGLLKLTQAGSCILKWGKRNW